VSVRARANGVHMSGIDALPACAPAPSCARATPSHVIACLEAHTTNSAWVRDVWRVRVVLALLYALSSRLQNERMESEASRNGAQSMTSWGGWTTDDENGTVVRCIQFPACSSRLPAASPLQASIDARVCCKHFGARGGGLLFARLYPMRLHFSRLFCVPAMLHPRSRWPHSDTDDALQEVEHRGVEEA
jgi:hypothetical protein